MVQVPGRDGSPLSCSRPRSAEISVLQPGVRAAGIHGEVEGCRQTPATKPLVQSGPWRPRCPQHSSLFGFFQSSREQPRLNRSLHFQSSVCALQSVTWGKILQSHLWRSCLAVPEVFSSEEQWLFNTPCPPSQIQPPDLDPAKRFFAAAPLSLIDEHLCPSQNVKRLLLI